MCRDCNPLLEFYKNGLCKNLKKCNNGKFETRNATSTTDRECDSCPDETFSGEQHTTKCIQWRQCGETEVEKAPPTVSTDRVCDICNPDENEFRNATDEANSKCSKATICQPGAYVDVQPTATTNRECKSCPKGKYTEKENALQCRPVTPCEIGFGLISDPTPTSDRECAECKLGKTFSIDESLETCDEVRVCGPGNEEKIEPTSSSDRDCVSCDKGRTFKLEFGNDRCQSVKKCLQGQAELSSPTISSDRECDLCRDGTFASYSKNSCLPHRGICEAGTYETIPATATTDRECLPCDLENGFYQDDAGLFSLSGCRAAAGLVCKHQVFLFLPWEYTILLKQFKFPFVK